jgi:hypothetical protein
MEETPTPTPTPTVTIEETPTPTPTVTMEETPTPTPTVTMEETPTPTPTQTPSSSSVTQSEVSAYFVNANTAYGGKYCEDGTFDGKPKYRKTGTNYYIYWITPENGWGIYDDLGNTEPMILAENVGGDTPPTGNYAFADFNTGGDLGVFNNFYTTANPPTFYTTYIHYGSTYNGKPVYGLGGRELKYEPSGPSGPAWMISDIESGMPLYQNVSTSNTPPLTGWIVFFGSEPVPTLIGPTCVSVSVTPTTTETPTPTPTQTAPIIENFNPIAVLLTSGTSYTVPAGATSMKAWAIGAGGNAANSGYGSAGGVAYKTWSVTPGGSVAYALGFGHATDNWNDPRQDTTITYNGTTITGGTAGPQPNVAGGFSGGDGGANGGTGGTGYRNNYYSGAVGGNDPSVNWRPDSGCETMTAFDISGLFYAVTLAGGNASNPCATPASFGTGGGYLRGPGYGGGGGSGTFEAQPGGPAAVVLYFT